MLNDTVVTEKSKIATTSIATNLVAIRTNQIGRALLLAERTGAHLLRPCATGGGLASELAR
jgi:hypothetical protein